MKKIIMASIMLVAALTANAQLKVAPKMQKGLERTYTSEVLTSVPGQEDVKIISDTKYKVTEANADGYIIEVSTTTFSSDAKADNIVGQIMGLSEEVMKNLSVRFATDKDVKVQKILNYDEVKVKVNEMADKLIDKLIETVPQITQMMSKDMLKQQVVESATEDNIVKSMLTSTSPLALNGMTVMTGAQDEYVNVAGIKMKRMFFVNGKNITTNSSMNMSNDEMKQLIIAQVEKMAPDQAEMIKKNIDAVMASGMIKIDMKGTATYELQDDGWVKTIKNEETQETMGQQAKTTATVTLKQ